MSGLSDKQLASLMKKLDKRETELSAELASMNSEAIDEALQVPHLDVGDSVDQGDALARETVRQAERDRDAMELRRIAEAKARMRNGSYGQCIDCGTSIPRARLEVQPYSERCVPCQEEFEQRAAMVRA